MVALINQLISLFCIYMKSGFEIQFGALNRKINFKVEARLSLEVADGEFNSLSLVW